jgi:hypothetical protein
MSLIPRWHSMTDESKALTKRTAVSALVVLLVFVVFRSLVPWVLVGLVAWWSWKAVSQSCSLSWRWRPVAGGLARHPGPGRSDD